MGKDLPTQPTEAAEFVATALADKPQLTVHGSNLPATAYALRDIFAATDGFFDRGGPVRLVQPANGGMPSAVPLTTNNVVMATHGICQPVRFDRDGKLVQQTLSDRVARMYLDMAGEWNLPPLLGITTAPLLDDDGAIFVRDGYDSRSGLWCTKVPAVVLPERPSRTEAEVALLELRRTFRTFPFADSPRCRDEKLGVDVVDVRQAPGYSESAFLAGLLTAVCRPSLWLAPGFMVTAPAVSGAGSGKGLLIRAICAIAFGIRPRAFTAGSERQELEKRVASELIEAAPVLFLDNLNGVTLRSDLLASILTERPARVRVLGESRMALLNSTAFIAVTGNGLGLSEDLVRRFVQSALDPRCEDPEGRPFAPGFILSIERRRSELLASVLTIWRWGRQNALDLARGRPLGSYEQWCEWVRDPLLTLGCCDPVEQIGTAKANDPRRQRLAELFEIWWNCHGDAPMKVAELHQRVRDAADPQSRGRQYLVTQLSKLADTRAAGFVLTRQEAIGKWGAATYVLSRTVEAAEGNRHRGHRDHRDGNRDWVPPMPPMPPMPDELEATDIPAGGEWTI